MKAKTVGMILLVIGLLQIGYFLWTYFRKKAASNYAATAIQADNPNPLAYDLGIGF